MSEAFFLILCGVFTCALGLIHFFLPHLLDFQHAIPNEGSPLKHFKFLNIAYATKRSDVLGIAWVMNHAVSYVLVTIGILDLMHEYWLTSEHGTFLGLWIAGWWFIRAGAQLYLGKRKGDFLILIGFLSLGIVHLIVVFD